MPDPFILLAVGDIGPDRAEPADCFALARDLVRSADLAFCHLDLPLTEGGTRLPQARHTVRSPIKSAAAMRDAGFSVVSFASNHCMDWGREAFQETIGHLEAAHLTPIGVGRNVAEARAPRFVETAAGTIAFIGACSILPQAYWAEAARPGCAPMRAFTVYEQIEHDQPGTPARIHTYAHREDLAALAEAVRTAKERADVVIVSLHWGIHFIPAVLADYQHEVAHALIDAGADAILGHHAHILKGVEFYRGKPIFHSLGNFAIDLRMDPEHARSKGFREIQALSPGWEPDFGSLYNFPPDSRMTILARLELAGGQLVGTGFVPAWINRDAQPEPLGPSDPRFAQVTDYLDRVGREAGLATRLVVNGAYVDLLPAEDAAG